MKALYFNNEEDFIKASADYILAEALLNVSKMGSFTISLAGGSTPPKIYEKLTTPNFKEKFPWSKTYFFLGDERILPPKNPESNIYMVNKSLFSKIDIKETNKIFPNTKLNSPEEIASDYETKIKEYFKDKKTSFDLILLGMGLDGHTASLFPDDTNWQKTEKLVIPTSNPKGKPEVFRISIGLSMINQAKKILFMISGNEKKEIAQNIIEKTNSGKFPQSSPILKIKDADNILWHIN